MMEEEKLSEELALRQSKALQEAEKSGFIDPISSLITPEPVIFGDGHNYDEEQLEYWLEQGKNTSPLTNIPLETTSFVPAQLLRDRIREFLKKHKHLIIENQVYLPRKYLKNFAEAIKNKNVEKIIKLADVDIRLIYMSAQQAIQKCGTKYRDETEASDRSGFHLACEVADMRIVMQMLEMLTANKVSLNFITAQKPSQWNPIVLNQGFAVAMENGNEDTCREFLSIGADANFTGKKGNLLHLAVKKQKKETVEWLLAYGANIDAQCDKFSQQTPLHVAVENGNFEVAKILLENGANTEIKAEKKWGSNLIGDRSLPLHIACRNGNESMVKLLLEHGANIEGKDNYGNHKDDTPLICASTRGHVAVVKLLLKSEANVDTKDNSGWTALHWAVRERQKKVIKLLMKHGADHKAKDSDGSTPAEIALRQKDQIQGKETAGLISRHHRERKLNAIKRTEKLEKRVQEQQKYIQKLEARLSQLENLVKKPIINPQLKRSQSLDNLFSKSRFFETPQISENNQQITAVPKQTNAINTKDDRENLQRGIQASLKQAEEDEVKQTSSSNKHCG